MAYTQAILHGVLILCAAALVILTTAPAVLPIGQKNHTVVSVTIMPETTVTAYAMAKASIQEEFPVNRTLLENILTGNRAALPEYISDSMNESDLPAGITKGITRAPEDATDTRRVHLELVTRNREKVLLVFRTDDGMLHYAYLKERPEMYFPVLPDGTYPTVDSAVHTKHYAGAEMMSYPVFSLDNLDRFGIDHSFINGNISVLAEFVGYIPDHHDVFYRHHR